MPSFSPSKPEPFSTGLTTITTQQPPPPPKYRDGRAYGSLTSLRHLFTSTSSKRTPSPPPATTNVCMHCTATGHWSNDCPLRCSSCQNLGLEGRGHEVKSCRPICLSCNGTGNVGREEGDQRMPVELQLHAAVGGVRRAVGRMREEKNGGKEVVAGLWRKDSTTTDDRYAANVQQHQLDYDLTVMLMWAGRVEADLKKLGA